MSLTTFLKKLSPGRIIALGFLFYILLGSLLLMLPCSLQPGIALPYLDALYTATSAVCVTGLNVIDPGSTFSPFGQFVLGCLIQIGGLGVASIGVGIMLAMGKKINLKERRVIRDAMNLDSGKGLIRFVKAIFCTTLLIELLGAFLSFPVFFRDYPLPRAIGLSLFHSVASFNNSGFDVLGNGTSLIPYQKDVLLNLVTCALVIAGGIGFPVIFELPLKHFSWKRQSMHTRVVLSTTFALLLFGTLLLKLTESISWLGAFFYSVSARTAGFSTYNLSDFSTAGRFRTDVYRGLSRVHRRRHQDHHLFCPALRHLFRSNKPFRKSLPQRDPKGRVPQGLRHQYARCLFGYDSLLSDADL